MAGEAGFEGLAWRHERKSAGDGSATPLGLHVGLSGAVAALASGPFRRLLTRGDAFEVWVAKEGLPNAGSKHFRQNNLT